MTYRRSEDFAQETSPFRRLVYGMIRKFAIKLTDTARWQLIGQRGGQGGVEVIPDIEAFTGIGFYARPPSSGNPEAIGVCVGGTKNTVIVAARDEATRQAVAGNIGEDETAVFNSQVILAVRANGTIEIGGPGSEPTMKGSTYVSAEDTLLSALSVFLVALNTYVVAIKPTADPSNAATPAMTAAITAMNTAIATFRAAESSFLAAIALVK